MTRAHSRSLIGVATVASLVLTLAGCATESHQAVQVERPAAASIAYSGPRSAIAVGKFDNRSTYMRGLFSDGIDRLGGQAKTILVGHFAENRPLRRAGSRQHGGKTRARHSCRAKQQRLQGAGGNHHGRRGGIRA